MNPTVICCHKGDNKKRGDNTIIQNTEEMEQCRLFKECSAPLCPLDSNLNKRIWCVDEPICKSRKFGQHRWIKKQRSIRKRQTKSWLDQPITYQDLYAASRKRNLSEKQLIELRARMKKCNPTYVKNTENKQIESNVAVF